MLQWGRKGGCAGGISSNAVTSMHLTAEEVTKAGASIDEGMRIPNAIVDAVMQANN